MFGFNGHDRAFYLYCAMQYSHGIYDKEFDISPARLYCAYAICQGKKPFVSDEQRACHLRSSALFVLDMYKPSVCLEAYLETHAWLVEIGWPFQNLSEDSFLEFAKIHLAKMEQKYGKNTVDLSPALHVVDAGQNSDPPL